ESLLSSDKHYHDNNGDHNHGGKDPHVWLDPTRMIQMGEVIKDELNSIFPEQQDSFEKNFKTFEANMLELDDEFSQTLLFKENKIHYVIIEQTVTDKVSEIIRVQIDATALYIHNLESLTEEDIDNDEDYLAIMRKNLEVLDKVTN